MRIVFLGLEPSVIAGARSLIDAGHDLVIIDRDAERIHELQDELDCAFLHGDGTRPGILRQALTEGEDAVLLCVTSDDQTNILASLVGRSIGFARVVTAIADPELESVCRELGLEDVILPSQSVGRALHDLALGTDHYELTSALRHGARLVLLPVEEDGGLDLPRDARLVCLYRDERIVLADQPSEAKRGDTALVFGPAETCRSLERGR